MFELNLAARLVRGGAPTQLGTNTDIVCKIQGAELRLECKRPFREKTVPHNISQAAGQLTRRLNEAADQTARGIIGVSVSRLLNPGEKILRAKTPDDMEARLVDDVTAQAQKSCAYCWQTIADARIAGILFDIITPAFVEDGQLLTAAQQTVMLNVPTAGTFEVSLLRRLEQVLRKPNAGSHNKAPRGSGPCGPSP